MRKFLVLIFCILSFQVSAMEKKTTFDKDLFQKAQDDGKVVVVSSWIKYCYSCAGQMKILQKAEKDFENIKYFSFDVTNKEISNIFKVEYQTTLLIFKNNEEIYRSIGETSKEEIYKAIESSI
ncbi:thioredoxin family protein [Pelagibacterales bacterium SAG-MED15]|nr:thioredoxin family protein [Pelagibacterales bacterium SAG-MED15]